MSKRRRKGNRIFGFAHVMGGILSKLQPYPEPYSFKAVSLDLRMEGIIWKRMHKKVKLRKVAAMGRVKNTVRSPLEMSIVYSVQSAKKHHRRYSLFALEWETKGKQIGLDAHLKIKRMHWRKNAQEKLEADKRTFSNSRSLGHLPG